MRSLSTLAAIVAVFAAGAVLTACDMADSAATTAGTETALTANNANAPVHARIARDLAAARAATARFQRVQAAEAAGYEQGTPCLELPGVGGMGYHWINEDYFGPADALDVRFPQALMYEPMSNGRLNLVGLEYIVWFDDHGPDLDPPILFGQEFHHGPIPAWILHVWTWKHNPEGIFEDWNPNVSCEYAN